MQHVTTLGAIDKDDVRAVGIRARDLAVLAESRFSVPETIVVDTETFATFIEHNRLKPKMDFLLSHTDMGSKQSLMNAYTSMRIAINDGAFPTEMEKELREMYESISSEGVGLSGKRQPLRVIVSTDTQEDPESNDTVIQNVRNWDEFSVAVKEAWALAFLPRQLLPRLRARKLARIGLIVQAMEPADVSVHAHSAMPEDSGKVYLEVYYGYLDLREKVRKDHYAIMKETLETVLSDVKKQTEKLDMHNGDLVIVQVASHQADDKAVRRELEEIARLTKKAERVLETPIKALFAMRGERTQLLWANRLPFGEQEVEVVDIPEINVDPTDNTKTLNEALSPEAAFAQTEHAAQEALQEAADAAERLQERTMESRRKTPNVKLLDASLRSAVRVIGRKYEKIFGQEGDDFREMVRQLNEQRAFSRQLDMHALSKAHDAVQRDEDLDDDDYVRAVEEITFLLGSA